MRLQLSASPRRFLQWMLGLRVCALLGQCGAVVVADRWLHLMLPLHQIALVIAAFGAVTLVSALRLRSALPATQLEVALQLLIDIAELTALLFLSGGTTNPFASLYLIPVALAAVGLAWSYAVLTAACSLGCYAWLTAHFSMPPSMQGNGAASFNLHVLGMHFTFVISTVLLAAALAGMAAEMRRRDQLMATMREDSMRQEHLSAIGMLAAGAAHELSTPLFSMAMLVSELKGADRVDQQFRSDLSLLERQIHHCKEKLTSLLQAAGTPRAPERRGQSVQTLLRKTFDDWRLTRPAVQLEIDWQGVEGDPCVSVDEGFAQSLGNLLDNAADASAACGSESVRVFVSGDELELQIAIEDEGPGLDPDLQRRAGKAIFSTKPRGLGLGLVLSHANLNRLNGQVALASRATGGTRTTIRVPLSMGEANRGEP